MAASLLPIPSINPALNSDGSLLVSGLFTFYNPGTNDKKSVYADPELSVPHTNPVVLDGNGKKVIYLSGDYDLKIEDSLLNQIDYIENINPDSAGGQTGVNLVDNGSFELNTLGDGKTPDSWTLNEVGTASLDSDSAVGSQAMKFASTGAGGGDIITTDFFEVGGGDVLTLSFYLKSTVVDVRNLVQIHWYDSGQSFISSDSVYDESAANPTSYTRQVLTSTAPANARFGKLQLFGCHPSDATVGDTFFDGVELIPSSIGGAFVSGTKMLFAQQTAPAGWTKSTTWDDRVMRVVSGNNGGSTGGNNWTITGINASSSGNLPNHLHNAGNYGVTVGQFNLGGETGATERIANNQNYVESVTGDSGNPTNNPSINISTNVNQSGGWRPPTLDSIIASKD